MTKTVAIIQARIGSTRLPGKALEEIAGRTMLERVVTRVRRARTIDVVAIATTTAAGDEKIVAEASRLDAPVVRGSEEDVLSRYLDAARATDADFIVRITSDCPLIDPAVTDYVVSSFRSSYPRVDYASNTIVRTYPRGLDTEVFTREGLERAAAEAVAPHQREHVTPYFYDNPDIFRLLHVFGRTDLNSWRWTVDTPDDMRFVREVYGRMDGDETFSWRDVVDLLEREPELREINSHIRQKPTRQVAK